MPYSVGRVKFIKGVFIPKPDESIVYIFIAAIFLYNFLCVGDLYRQAKARWRQGKRKLGKNFGKIWLRELLRT